MESSYIDIHSHLNASDFDQDREVVIAQMKAANVSTITVGTDMATSRQAIKIAGMGEGLWATVGIHPTETLPTKEEWKELEKMATEPKVVAIGECGLDYFERITKGELLEVSENTKINKEQQKDLFIRQVALAIEIDKPLMLHCRPSTGSQDAYLEVLEILRTYRLVAPNLRGNAHFFAGNLDTAKQFTELGFTVSFTGVITFVRDYDDVIKNIPLEMIMVETDAPFVSPVPYRGKRNEPTYVVEVIKKIAEIKNQPLATVVQAVLATAHRSFQL